MNKKNESVKINVLFTQLSAIKEEARCKQKKKFNQHNRSLNKKIYLAGECKLTALLSIYYCSIMVYKLGTHMGVITWSNRKGTPL